MAKHFNIGGQMVTIGGKYAGAECVMDMNPYSWEEIKTSLNNGNSLNFGIGATKTVTFTDGTTNTLRLSNMHSCQLYLDANGKMRNIILEFVDPIYLGDRMSDWEKCNFKYAWNYSPYYSICNTELYDKLPADLKNIAEEVTVTSYETSRYGSVYDNTCKSKITIPPTSNYKKPTDYTNMDNGLGNIISKNLSNYPLLDYYGNYILADTFYSFRRMINDCSFECLDKSYRIYVVPRDVQTNRNAFGLIQIYKAASLKSLSIQSYTYDLGRDSLTAKYPDKNIDGSGTFAKPIICI